MTRRAAPMSRTTLELDHASAVPLYRQIYERLRRAVLDGQLKTGERLPSTRELASELGVPRNTVFIAYEQLLAEGYIEGKVGYGTAVAPILPGAFLHVTTDQRAVAVLATWHIRSKGRTRKQLLSYYNLLQLAAGLCLVFELAAISWGYSYWTWWIIRSVLSKHTLGWIFVIRQGGQVTSSRGKAPSDDFY